MYENESLGEIDIFFIDKSPIIEMCFLSHEVILI